MSCETMSFRRYGERRQRRQCCVRRPQVGQPASYLSIQLPIVAQLLAHDACFLRSTEDPVHGRAGSHPKSLFRALSLSLPPSLQTHLRLRDAAGTRSPPPHPPFSLKECAPTLHFPVTSGGQPPRLRDGGLPCCCSPPASCSVLPVSRPPSDW
jgi:hypothetical protein